MSYINNNYNSNISLGDVAEKFFISKYHLCHMFKKATGLTVHRYITQKRITNVRESMGEGINITSAVINAGFSSYSSFYRSYIKEYGIPPKEGLLH